MRLVVLASAACVTLAVAVAAPSVAQRPASSSSDPTVGVHGMVLVAPARGPAREVLLSHLPMYRAPHRHQVIVRAALDAATQRLLAADRARHGDTLYTIEPERFALVHLDPARFAGPFAIRATLYRGHFERGGTPIARNVAFTLQRSLVFRPIHAEDVRPRGAQHAYLVPLGAEQLLVHRVAGAPSHEQLVRVEVTGTLRPQEAARAITIPGRDDGLPLRSGESVAIRAAGVKTPLRVRAARILHLERDDLALPRRM